MASTKAHVETMQPGPRVETVEEFLARGGRIERIEDHPDPEGRVLLRGQRERQQQFLSRAFNSAQHLSG
jgi:hypothetical protein